MFHCQQLDGQCLVGECYVVPEAERHANACGAGAIAVAIVFASQFGARHGILIQHTTSHQVLPMGRPADLVEVLPHFPKEIRIHFTVQAETCSPTVAFERVPH